MKHRTFKTATFITILALAALYSVVINQAFLHKYFCGSKFMDYPVAQNYDRRDWHDWWFIEYEMTREGPGEQGQAFYLTDAGDIELNKKLSQQEGLFAVVSDKISVNRSVPDTRLPA